MQKNRSKEIARFASAMVFKFRPTDDALLDLFSGFQFFIRGTGTFKSFQNVLKKSLDGQNVLVFDYTWTRSKHDSQPHAYETVIVFQFDRGKAPTNNCDLFELNKKNVRDYLGKEVPAFFKKCWLIEGKNEMIALCKTHGISDQRIKPNQLQDYIEQAEQILDLLLKNTPRKQ